VRVGPLGAGRAERAVADLRDRTTVALTARAAPVEVERLVAYLRRTGQLTPALLLRALLSSSTVFVEAAFAELARLPPGRVAGLLHDRRGAGLPALLDRAGLPRSLRPAFEAAIAGWRDRAADDTVPGRTQLSRHMIERVLSACAALPEAESGTLLALLRRYEAEAAREAAREAAGALAERAVLALEYKPQALITVDRDRLQDAA
jgi:uncharacterized protein (DUF2336 family)